MPRNNIFKLLWLVSIALCYTACGVPTVVQKTENKAVPASYNGSQDSTNSGSIKWRDFFSDPYLVALIDTALQNNQEYNILLQEITVARSEVQARKGEYLPSVSVGAGAGVEKVGRYTSQGANDANTDIAPGREFPEPLPDLFLGANVSWEVDIWRKLRNAKQSALYRYLATVEGRNFMVTNLISEIASSYYELLALDNQLDILQRNIEIQKNALEIVKLQKQAAQVTELAVRKFEAEVLKNQSRLYYIQQQIVETENRINYLVGRFPQPVQRNSKSFSELVPDTVYAGIPSQLLQNRPDIRQAELELAANKLDVKVAKANFYPAIRITAGIGYQAFNPSYLVYPESMIFSLAGDLVAPLINKNAIKAQYYAASARQTQAVYNYEQTILVAYIEVANQVVKVSNLEQSYSLKSQEVEALTESINIANGLFRSARADYMEVLMTQRDALEARMDLIEIKQEQMNAVIGVYRALGGGWQ